VGGGERLGVPSNLGRTLLQAKCDQCSSSHASQQATSYLTRPAFSLARSLSTTGLSRDDLASADDDGDFLLRVARPSFAPNYYSSRWNASVVSALSKNDDESAGDGKERLSASLPGGCGFPATESGRWHRLLFSSNRFPWDSDVQQSSYEFLFSPPSDKLGSRNGRGVKD
jgi:hypothetical protein